MQTDINLPRLKKRVLIKSIFKGLKWRNQILFVDSTIE